MSEMTFPNGSSANIHRRRLINQGVEVSLVAYDPARDVYVFDCLDEEES